MTTKEALKLVEFMDIALKLDCDSAVMKKETLQSIKEVAEKQIPKKIKISEYESFGLFFFCPNCGVNIGNGLYKQKYCHNCGQALDWEDVK